VGLITSDGPHGPNIMAAEWTHHVSYSPGLIAVCFGPNRTTLENIRATKKFGVSLAANAQNVISSVAGGAKGMSTDKINALRELGFKFYKGKTGLLMVEDAALNAECKVINEIQLGDHTMVVGEVVEMKISNKEPIAYHQGKYWMLNTNVQKPSDKEREIITNVVEKHRKKTLIRSF
jgi:flavin reductase (DIM6/NTAB) family NADH-FMN oxidoreductase RutF